MGKERRAMRQGAAREGGGASPPSMHNMAREGGRALLLPCDVGGTMLRRWEVDVSGKLSPSGFIWGRGLETPSPSPHT